MYNPSGQVEYTQELIQQIKERDRIIADLKKALYAVCTINALPWMFHVIYTIINL